MSGAIEEGAHIGFATPRYIDNEDAALSLVPNNALESDRGAWLTGTEAVGFGDGADRGANAYVDHILTAITMLGPFRWRGFALLVASIGATATSGH